VERPVLNHQRKVQEEKTMHKKLSFQLAAFALSTALTLPGVLLAAEKDNMMKDEKSGMMKDNKTGAVKDEKGKMIKDNMKSEKGQAKKSGDKMKTDKMEDKKM
jgi:hypothetical protein